MPSFKLGRDLINLIRLLNRRGFNAQKFDFVSKSRFDFPSSVMLRLCIWPRISRSLIVNVRHRQSALHPWLACTPDQTLHTTSYKLVRQLSTSVEKVLDEPLRILYCGSDAFSCTSLKALHQEAQRSSSNIASIDVVCREGKPYGRGLRVVRHRT